MTALDGGAMDPKVARVLLQLREEVAQATERAYRKLAELGAWRPGDDLPQLNYGEKGNDR